MLVSNCRFEIYEWLRYHQQKQSAFCKVGTEYGKSFDPSPFISNNNAVGFPNWKNELNKLANHGDSRSYNIAEKDARPASSSDLPINAHKKRLASHFGLIEFLLWQSLAF